ncbi:MAG: putative toxin, partial [Thermoleophilia bacterium]
WSERGIAVVFLASGGVGKAAKGVKLADDLFDGAKAIDKARDADRAGDAMARGRASEKRVLDELGLEPNTRKVSTPEGNSIPDALTDDYLYEIKDCASVYCTRQVRIQTGAARESGRKSVLITGTNTHISKTTRKAYDEIIHRDDLGPQP